MTRKRAPYKTYTREFKVEAVRLMTESDRPSAEIATELGVTILADLRGQSPNCQFTFYGRASPAKPIRLFKVFSFQLQTTTSLRYTWEQRCCGLGL